MWLSQDTPDDPMFTSYNSEQIWPRDDFLFSSSSADHPSTGMDVGHVSWNLFTGQGQDISSALSTTYLHSNDTAVGIERNDNHIYAMDDLSGGTLGSSHTYSPTTLGLAPVSSTGMYGAGWDHPNRPQPLPSSTWPPPIPSKQHICTLCPETTTFFTLKKDLNRHIKTVHATGGEQVYRCRCEKDGVRKDNYLRHVRSCNKECTYSNYKCKCLYACAEKQEHIDHVAECQYSLGSPGRPNAS